MRIDRALADLRARSFNFDIEAVGADATGWQRDERLQPLPAEAPGDPVPDGPWDIARRLMRGYEFADPAMVRAHYDRDAPLEGRDMLLEVRFYGLRFLVGCRVTGVYERSEEIAGRPALVSGWSYRTLEGHFEQGEMHWQVAKWPDTGEVAFAISALSRRSSDPNPVVRLGFRLFGRREQLRFYDSTCRRMRVIVEETLRGGASRGVVRDAAERTTSATARDAGGVNEDLARNVAPDGR